MLRAQDTTLLRKGSWLKLGPLRVTGATRPSCLQVSSYLLQHLTGQHSGRLARRGSTKTRPVLLVGVCGPRRASTATLSSLLPGPSNVPLHKQPEDARSAPRPEHWHCPAASQKPEAATAAVAIMAGCHWQPPSQVDSELPQWQIVDFRFMPPGASGCRCQCRRNQSGIRRRSGMIARGFRL